ARAILRDVPTRVNATVRSRHEPWRESPLRSEQRYGRRSPVVPRRGLRTGCSAPAPAGKGRRYLLVLLAQASARIYGYLSGGAPKCGQQGAAALAMVLSATYLRRPHNPDDS